MFDPISVGIGGGSLAMLLLIHQYGYQRGHNDAEDELVELEEFTATLGALRRAEAVRNDVNESEGSG